MRGTGQECTEGRHRIMPRVDKRDAPIELGEKAEMEWEWMDDEQE